MIKSLTGTGKTTAERKRFRMPEPRALRVITGGLPWPDRCRREMSLARSRCRERRARVLSYPDLAAELCREPCGYARPDQWNGYVPPAVAVIDDGGLLRSAKSVNGGIVRIRHSQVGAYSAGEIPNESARRAVLVAISAEAWQREHPPQDES